MMQRIPDHELIEHMPAVAQRSENPWPRSFAYSVMKQAATRPSWQPSPKQARIMRLFISQLQEEDDFPVIDRHDDGFECGEHTGNAGHIDRKAV